MDSISQLQSATEELHATSGSDDHLERLTQLCVDDLISAFGLGEVSHGLTVMESISRIPARRLARQILTYDRIVGESGLGTGGAWALKRLSRNTSIEGQKNVPRGGPLLFERRPLRPPRTRACGRPRRGQRCDLTFCPAQPPDPPAPPQTRPRVARRHAPGARPGPAQRRRQGGVRKSPLCRTGSGRPRCDRGDAATDGGQEAGMKSDVWRRRSPLVFLFVTVFVDMIGYGIVVPLLPLYASPYASGAVLVGLLGSLYAAMQFVGGPFLGGLSDRHGRRPVLLTCLLGTSLAYLLLGLAQTLAYLVCAVVLAGAASGTLATAQAYIADSTAREDRARGLGMIGAAFGLGLMAGPAIGGLLSLHSLSTPALFASTLALINFIFGYLTLPESHAPHLRKRIPL